MAPGAGIESRSRDFAYGSTGIHLFALVPGPESNWHTAQRRGILSRINVKLEIQ